MRQKSIMNWPSNGLFFADQDWKRKAEQEGGSGTGFIYLTFTILLRYSPTLPSLLRSQALLASLMDIPSSRIKSLT